MKETTILINYNIYNFNSFNDCVSKLHKILKRKKENVITYVILSSFSQLRNVIIKVLILVYLWPVRAIIVSPATT